MAQSVGNARNILVGASPLFLSVTDITSPDYVASAPAGVLNAFAANKNKTVPAFKAATSYTDTLNAVDVTTAATGAVSAVCAAAGSATRPRASANREWIFMSVTNVSIRWVTGWPAKTAR